MSYSTVTQLRVYLDQDAATLDSTLQAVLDRAHSDLTLALGFAFGGNAVTRKLDADGESELWLPAPGAASVSSVVVDGATVPPAEYELDWQRGRFLVRLDSAGDLGAWPDGRRSVTVTYTPAAAPAALVQAELAEAVRIWRAKDAGYADVVGVAGSNEIGYSKAFLASTARLITTLRGAYGASGMGGA